MRASSRIAATALLNALLAVVLSCSDAGNLAPGEENNGPADVLTVRIASELDTLVLGGSRQYAATVVNQFNVARPDVIEWTSSNPSVATVSRVGMVDAVGPGASLIIATASGAADSAVVVVTGNVSALSITPNAVSAMQGDSLLFEASASLASGESVTPAGVKWSSSDSTIVTVSGGGIVSSLNPGNAVVTAEYLGITAAAAVDVKRNEIATVLLSPANVSLYPTQTQQLTAALLDANGRSLPRNNIEWSTSVPGVAVVSGNGLVSAVAKGITIITAMAGGKSATATVSVFAVPAASVTVTLASGEQAVGRTLQAHATVKDAAGNTLTGRTIGWYSSDPAIATINGSGLVTGIAAGNVTISGIVDGKVGRASLRVVTAVATTLAIQPGNASLQRGQTAQLSAKLLDQTGNELSTPAVTWSSANPTVATVSSAGVVTAVSTGTTTVQASANGLTSSVAVSVNTVRSASIQLTPTSFSIAPGGTFQLSAVVLDADGGALADRVVAWSSSNLAAATVSPTGLVTGVGAGSASIRASIDGITATSAATVTAPPPADVASIGVVLNATSIAAGQVTQATATLRDDDGNILTGRVLTWSSANTEVATVSASGLVTALQAGSVAIIASSEGVTGAATLTVNPPAPAPVAAVEVTANPTSIITGGTTQLVVTVRDASGNVLSGQTIGYASSSTAIASVNTNGLVTGVAVGSATITASSGGKSGSVSMTVTSGEAVPAPVASVTVTLNSSSINIGQSSQATAVLKDAAGNVLTGRSISWSSNNTAVASVSSGGLVTGVGGGTASIVATSGGVSGSAAVAVSAPVATVTVSLASTSLAIGSTTQATAVLKDASGNVLSGRAITWNSSAVGVASVSSSGLVTAIAPGSATIQATSEGKSASATVTVGAAAVATVTVSLTSSTLVIGQTSQALATARDAAGNLILGRPVSWTMASGVTLATVSSSGVVTAMAAGTATVRATIDGKSGNATLLIASSNIPVPLPAAPALPQVFVNSTYVPPTGRTLTVNAGQSLQSAIDQAVGGDVILLQPGATFVGPFYLRKKTSGSGWITIRSAASDASLPAAGQRMTSSYASQLPKLVSAGGNASVIYTDRGASHWRLMALEITVQPSVTVLNALMRIGDPYETNASNQAYNIILDRLYVHGSSTLDLQRCIMLNSAAAAIIDSHVGDCWSKNYDSQAIGGWNGPGPFKITNNFLEASGENIMFGGADPRTVGLVPSDMEIRGNHIFKNPAWKGSGRIIKNLFELKNAQRVLLEGNLLDGSWNEGQAGAAINLKSENAGGTAPWSVTRDVTIRYNRVRNAGAGVAMAGIGSGSGSVNERTRRIAIVHNVFDNINVGIYTGDAYLFSAGGGMEDVTMDHNTIITSGYLSLMGGMDNAPAITRYAFRCNIIMTGAYGLKGSGTATGTATLNTYTPSYTFTNNVLVGQTGTYPATTAFAAKVSDVGFIAVGSDYRLSSGSAYRGACPDGSDPGADVVQLSSAVANVIVP